MGDLLHDARVGAGAPAATGRAAQPRDDGDPAAEYAAVRGAVGLFDRTAQGLIEVTGRDRASFLHAILTNDVKSLAAGQGCAAALLDVHGKVEVFTGVWVLDDRILVMTPPGRAESTIEKFDKYLFAEKAYFRDASGEHALFLLAGPGTGPVVAAVAGVELPEAAWSHLAGRVSGVDVRVVRGAGETGETEAWMLAPSSEAHGVREALLQAGARPTGETAWEALRIEAGTPIFGRETDATVLLPEIPFLDRVSYTKGCYVGQEVVVRIRDRGHVNRHLRGLVLEGDQVPSANTAVLAGDMEVGRVTSAAWSYGLGRPIALAFVRRQHAEPGTSLRVRVGDQRTIDATVSALPFAR